MFRRYMLKYDNDEFIDQFAVEIVSVGEYNRHNIDEKYALCKMARAAQQFGGSSLCNIASFNTDEMREQFITYVALKYSEEWHALADNCITFYLWHMKISYTKFK